MPCGEVWTKTEDGYVTEVSDLQANKDTPEALMPEDSRPFQFHLAVTLKDHSENEILGWAYHHPNGRRYVVFND
jgi:hypothetical protein